jgi:hypothetical protein
MSRKRSLLALVILALVTALVWVLFVGLPRWTAPRPAEPPPATASAAAAPTPKIRARLYYLAADGLALQAADREVVFGEGTAEQARHLVEALLEPPPEPLVGVIPAGTRLRTLFLSARGVAFVDLSGEAATNHGGGALDELYTVYSIVNTLTENLPGVTAVQILLDGREVDTLAGHADLRRPLVRSARWTERPTSPVARGPSH